MNRTYHFALSICAVILMGTCVAQAQKIKLPIDPLGLNGKPGLSLPGSKPAAAPTTCDFNTLANLTATSVVEQIDQCVQSNVSGIANLFLPDVEAALGAAGVYGDQPGIACLKPALAIVQAAVGTPAVPAVAEIPATSTTPAVPAVAAIAAVLPGPILIFQMFRQFELSGGPAACKTWVNSTISGANPLTQ